MSLLSKLTEDMKTSMRARDSERLTTVRGLIAEIKRIELDSKTTMREDDEISFLTTQAKRRREAIDAFAEARPELADKERAELSIIEEYLPKQLSEDEAAEIVRGVIQEVGASSPKDLGRVMGKAMGALKGRFPGNQVKDLATRLLQD